MAEAYAGQIARLNTELQQASMKLNEMTAHMQGYLREQQHVQEDVVEVRDTLRALNRLLREDVVLKVTILEHDVQDLRTRHTNTRDWWLKVSVSVTATVIVAGLGFVLWVYSLTKGVLPKP